MQPTTAAIMQLPAAAGQLKRKRINDTYQSKLQVTEKTSRVTEKVSEDEFTSFGIFVAAQLRGMSKMSRCIAQKVISDALFLGSMDIIEPSSQILNGQKNVRYPSNP